MNNKALTLIEIIVSTFLIALVLAGLVSLFVTGKSYVRHSHSRISAAELGKVFLNPRQMDVRQDTWSSNCLNNSAACPGPQTINNVEYTPIYNISDVSGTNLKRVTLTIGWNETQPE